MAAEGREFKLDQTFVSDNGGTVETRILIVCDREGADAIDSDGSCRCDCKRVYRIYAIPMGFPSPYPLSAYSLRWLSG